MRIAYLLFFALATLLSSQTALSHHSFSAEFDVGRPVEITGTVVHLEWTNPHAWVHIDTKDDKGNIQRWKIEMLGINMLVRAGITPQTVKKGDVLTVTGYGSRDGTNTANAASITRTETGETLWG